jgi:hypothetical protein
MGKHIPKLVSSFSAQVRSGPAGESCLIPQESPGLAVTVADEIRFDFK